VSYGLLRRWSGASRSARVAPAHRAERRTFDVADVEQGWVVVDCLGARIGRLERVDRERLVLGRRPWRRPLVVPVGYIGEVHEGRVVLNRSRDAIAR